jgi:hypothetical protein
MTGGASVLVLPMTHLEFAVSADAGTEPTLAIRDADWDTRIPGVQDLMKSGTALRSIHGRVDTEVGRLVIARLVTQLRRYA